jgi:hypothetical protein
MVNSQSQNNQLEYNTYYRPNLNSNNDDFFPVQGMIPRYKFVNHQLVDIIPDPRNESFDLREFESYQYIENTNDFIYAYSLLTIPILMIISIICIKLLFML